MTTAIVIGGTGLVGSHLVKQLSHPTSSFSRVFLIARNAKKLDLTSEASAKITPIEVPDFDSVFGKSGDQASILTKLEQGPTHAFCCLGTTHAKAGSFEGFRKVDHDYVVGFGRLCLAIQSEFDNSLKSFSLVSSAQANASSWMPYLKVKGETDSEISALLSSKVPKVNILRPGMLKYPFGSAESRKETRLFEQFLIKIDPLLEWIGPGKFSIDSDDVARAMIKLALDESLTKESLNILENKDLRGIVSKL